MRRLGIPTLFISALIWNPSTCNHSTVSTLSWASSEYFFCLNPASHLNPDYHKVADRPLRLLPPCSLAPLRLIFEISCSFPIAMIRRWLTASTERDERRAPPICRQYDNKIWWFAPAPHSRHIVSVATFDSVLTQISMPQGRKESLRALWGCCSCWSWQAGLVSCRGDLFLDHRASIPASSNAY